MNPSLSLSPLGLYTHVPVSPQTFPFSHAHKCMNFQLQIQFHYQSYVLRCRCTKETLRVRTYNRDWKCGNGSPLQTFKLPHTACVRMKLCCATLAYIATLEQSTPDFVDCTRSFNSRSVRVAGYTYVCRSVYKWKRKLNAAITFQCFLYVFHSLWTDFLYMNSCTNERWRRRRIYVSLENVSVCDFFFQLLFVIMNEMQVILKGKKHESLYCRVKAIEERCSSIKKSYNYKLRLVVLRHIHENDKLM